MIAFMKKLFSLLLLIVFALPCGAEEGYDYTSGTYSDVERSSQGGDYADVYDYSDGSFSTHPVGDRNQDSSELEVYDYNTGQYRYFEMD